MVSLGERKCGSGMGRKKDEAQNAAARDALATLLPNLVTVKARLEGGAEPDAESLVAVCVWCP